VGRVVGSFSDSDSSDSDSEKGGHVGDEVGESSSSSDSDEVWLPFPFPFPFEEGPLDFPFPFPFPFPFSCLALMGCMARSLSIDSSVLRYNNAYIQYSTMLHIYAVRTIV
jgi:hypothetical protein